MSEVPTSVIHIGSEVKTDSELIQWAVEQSRSRPHKAYPWHELQEIIFAIEHGLTEPDALAQAGTHDQPLSTVLPFDGPRKHDASRVTHLRTLISLTNWPQAERTYDDAQRRAKRSLP